MPKDDVRLSSQTEGLVMAFPKNEGDVVKAGDILVQLDDRAEKIQLENAKAALRRAKAEQDKAQKDLERVQSLYSDKIASDKQLQEALVIVEQSIANYLQAEQSVQMADLQLSYRSIKSPIEGVFLKKTKSVGEAVQRLEVVARVVDASVLELVTYASAQYFKKIHVGDTVNVQLLDGPLVNEVVPAVVSYVDPLIDPASGTFRVKLSFPGVSDVYSGIGALVLPDSFNHQVHP
jgi:RND family efflux transporter MFP subunit